MTRSKNQSPRSSLPSDAVMFERFSVLISEGLRGQWSVNGLQWYEDALEIVGHGKLNAIVTAILSPRISWEQNLVAAKTWLEGKPDWSIPVHTFGEKASRVMATWEEVEDPFTKYIDPRRAPKTHFFARAIYGDETVVVVDRHIVDAAFWEWGAIATRLHLRINLTEYARIAATLSQAAEQYKLTPAMAQSLIWHHWRESKKTRVDPRQPSLFEPQIQANVSAPVKENR